MEGGLLCLKWRDHRSTFFRMLSSVRKKEAYSDVTIACDGRFYPLHKLILSTCSDYFEKMFNLDQSRNLLIVLSDICHKELELLLDYMYIGEVNVLQSDLASFMRAAEHLMIKGLAEPPESTQRKDTSENKRSLPQREEGSEVKRRRQNEDVPVKVTSTPGRLSTESTSYRNSEASTEPKAKMVAPPTNKSSSIPTPEIVSPAQLASVELSTEQPTEMRPDPAPTLTTSNDHQNQTLEVGEIQLEEVQVKEEPTDWCHSGADCEPKMYDPGLEYPSQNNPPQPMSDVQPIAGPSGMQAASGGWDGVVGGGQADEFGQYRGIIKGHNPVAMDELEDLEIKEERDELDNPQPSTSITPSTLAEIKEEWEVVLIPDSSTSVKTPKIPQTTFKMKTKSQTSVVDPDSFLTQEEEQQLVSWWMKSNTLGFSHFRTDLFDAVQKILTEDGRKNPFPDNMPDKDWYLKFSRRHPPFNNKSENISVKNLQQWYYRVHHFLNSISALNLIDDPERVFSMDIMLFNLNYQNGGIFEPRSNNKIPHQWSLSVIETINASGKVLPPVEVWPQVEFVNPGRESHIYRSADGTVLPETFYKYIHEAFLPWLCEMKIKMPVILFMHGKYSPFITPEINDLYDQLKVFPAALHPTTTILKIEPTEVAICQSLRESWQSEMARYKDQNELDESTPWLPCEHFSAMLKSVHRRKVRARNVKEAFRKCGLYPFSWDEVDTSSLRK